MRHNTNNVGFALALLSLVLLTWALAQFSHPPQGDELDEEMAGWLAQLGTITGQGPSNRLYEDSLRSLLSDRDWQKQKTQLRRLSALWTNEYGYREFVRTNEEAARFQRFLDGK